MKKYFQIIGLYIGLMLMGLAVGIVKPTEGTAFGMVLFCVFIIAFAGILLGLINDTFFDWKIKSKIIDAQVRRMRYEKWRQDHSYLFQKQDVEEIEGHEFEHLGIKYKI